MARPPPVRGRTGGGANAARVDALTQWSGTMYFAALGSWGVALGLVRASAPEADAARSARFTFAFTIAFVAAFLRPLPEALAIGVPCLALVTVAQMSGGVERIAVPSIAMSLAASTLASRFALSAEACAAAGSVAYVAYRLTPLRSRKVDLQVLVLAATGYGLPDFAIVCGIAIVCATYMNVLRALRLAKPDARPEGRLRVPIAIGACATLLFGPTLREALTRLQ